MVPITSDPYLGSPTPGNLQRSGRCSVQTTSRSLRSSGPSINIGAHSRLIGLLPGSQPNFQGSAPGTANRWGTDAFCQDWAQFKGYANPLWCLIGRYLHQLQSQAAELILMTPAWMDQPWWPLIFSLSVDLPLILPKIYRVPNLHIIPNNSSNIKEPLMTSHVEALRKSFKQKNLSESSTRLLLNSW